MSRASASPSAVEYYHLRPTAEAHPDGGIVVTVPSRRTLISYATSFAAKTCVDLLAIPFIPLTFTTGIVLYTLFNHPRPRAVIRITPEVISLTASKDDSLGRCPTYASWPRKEVAEFRANRCGPGLYFRIAGKENLDLLTDLPDEWSREIEELIAPVLERFRYTHPSCIDALGN